MPFRSRTSAVKIFVLRTNGCQSQLRAHSHERTVPKPGFPLKPGFILASVSATRFSPPRRRAGAAVRTRAKARRLTRTGEAKSRRANAPPSAIDEPRLFQKAGCRHRASCAFALLQTCRNTFGGVNVRVSVSSIDSRMEGVEEPAVCWCEHEAAGGTGGGIRTLAQKKWP